MPWPDDDSENPGSWYDVSADVRPPDDRSSEPVLPWYMRPGDEGASYMPDRATTPPPPSRADDSSVPRGLMDTFVRAPAEGFVTGAGSALTGLGELYGRATDWTNRGFKALGVPDTGVQLPWYLNPGEILRRPGEQFKNLGQEIGVPEERKNYADEIGAGVGQIGSQILALMTTGGAGAVATMFGQGVDQTIDEVRRTGQYGTLQGDAAMIAGGAITAVTEKMGLDLLLNRMPPAIKNKVLRAGADILVAGGIEAAQEFLETVARNGMHNIVLGSNTPMLDGAWDASSVAGPAASIVRGMMHVPRPRGGRGSGALSQPTGRDVNYPDMESEPAAMRAQYAGSASLAPYDIPGMNGQMLLPGYDGQNLLPGTNDSMQLPGYGYTQSALTGPAESPPPIYLDAPPEEPSLPQITLGHVPKGALRATEVNRLTAPDPLGFYSAAAHFVDTLPNSVLPIDKNGGATYAEWKKALTKKFPERTISGPLTEKGERTKQKAPAAELAWSGFDDYFKLHPGLISREEMGDFFRNRVPNLNEVEHRSDQRDSHVSHVRYRLDDNGSRTGVVEIFDNSGRVIGTAPHREDAFRDINLGKYTFAGLFPSTKWEELSPPEGTNYREIMTHYVGTTPSSYAVRMRDRDTGVSSHHGNFPTREEAVSEYNRLRNEWRNGNGLGARPVDAVGMDAQGLPLAAPWRESTHFPAGFPDPLWFTRGADLQTQAAGDKAPVRTLGIDEKQADYAQHLRDQRNQAEKYLSEALERSKGYPEDERLVHIKQALDNYQESLATGTPPQDKHYLGNTKDWSLHLAKRTIARAIDEGFDRIAVAPGQLHSRRWQGGQMITDAYFDPQTNRVTLSNPEGTVLTTHLYPEGTDRDNAELIEKIGQPAVAKLIEQGKELMGKIERGESIEGYSQPPRKDFSSHTIEQEYDPDDDRPDFDDHFTVEAQPVDDPSYWYSVEEYEAPDENWEPGEGETEENRPTITMYRVVDEASDIVEDNFETEREAERSRESYTESLEPEYRYVLLDSDGDELRSFDSEREAERARQREVERAAENWDADSPARFVIHDAEGNTLQDQYDEDRTFSSEEDAEDWMKQEAGGGRRGEGPKVRHTLDEPKVVRQPFHEIYDKQYKTAWEDAVTAWGGKGKGALKKHGVPVAKEYSHYSKINDPDMWEVLRKAGKTYEEYMAMSDEEKAAAKAAAHGKYDWHYIDITPEMKANRKRGVPFKRGGRVGALNRYAFGGEVDDSPPNFTFNTPEPGSNVDSFETQSHPSGMMMPNMGFDVIPGPNNAFGDQPYDPALDAYVRQREQPMQPQLQKLSPPKSEGGGGGGDLGSMMSMAMKFLPMLLAEGGQISADPDAPPVWSGTPGVSLYRDGGAVEVPWERRSTPESFYMDDVLDQIFEDRDADRASQFAGEQMDLRHPFPPQRNYLGNPQDMYVPPSRRETRDAMFASGGPVSDYDLYHPIWQQSFAKGGSVLEDILGTVGSVGGTMLGSFFGGPIGGMVGGKAGRFLGSAGSNLIEGTPDEIDDDAMSISMPTMSDARAFMSRGGALRRWA